MDTKTTSRTATSVWQGKRLSAHQIVTTENLIAFKYELLMEFEKLFKSIQHKRKEGGSKAHQVRKLLSISTGTLQALKSSGVIPYTKIGGVHFFDYEDIQRILEERKNNPMKV